MYKRNCYSLIEEALQDTPVVLVCGARQVGKSTIIKEVINNNKDYNYFTMDDASTLAAASQAPASFLEGINGKIVIDEIQRVPELFLVIKKIIDENRQPGKFVLTGSANVFSLPKLSDSLAGRMEIINMFPLSQGEIHNVRDDFIDKSFNYQTNGEIFKNDYECNYAQIIEKIINGGYPEVLARASIKRKSAWFASYISALLQRDIRDLAAIEGLKELPMLLYLLAGRAGNLFNLSELSRIAKIPGTSLKRYIALLEAIFLITYIPSWYVLKANQNNDLFLNGEGAQLTSEYVSTRIHEKNKDSILIGKEYVNHTKRVVKMPKLYFDDTGLLCHLLGIDSKKLLTDRNFAGAMFENFVLMELIKQKSWSNTKVNIYHYRTSTGDEVDIVLEASNGDIVGIEVKSHEEVIGKDFNGLRALKKAAGLNFKAGYVLYPGKKKIQFDELLVALPIAAIWEK
jgi:predicted AAA+ superfamily ATPase